MWTMMVINSTKREYGALYDTHGYFNASLFGGILPQRKRNAYGFFAGERFKSQDGGEVAGTFRASRVFTSFAAKATRASWPSR
jgi:hypothetical protein